MVTPCTGGLKSSDPPVLYKHMENDKNQKFESFLYYGQNIFQRA